MKKVLKFIGIFILVAMLGIAAYAWYINKPLPVGKSGPEAQGLAEEMLEALHYNAWQEQSWVAWSFVGMHHYEWNKAKSEVTVQWDDKTVFFNTLTGESEAAINAEPAGQETAELVHKAKDMFYNDSFWLCAPFKVNDPDCELSTVALEDGTRGLLAHYPTGGATPGDTYLWHIGKDGKPVSFDIWASIVPIGGVNASWENWTELSEGALIANEHQLGPVSIAVENLRSN